MTRLSTFFSFNRAGNARGWIRLEILVVLAISFGMSGVRAALNLADSLLQTESLREQQISLSGSRSVFPLIDLAFQVCSAATLFAWSALALFLLAGDNLRLRKFRLTDIAWGLGLAAAIGVPGIVLYLVAIHQGWAKEIIPSKFETGWAVEFIGQTLWAAANAVGEEIVVVAWLISRLSGSRGVVDKDQARTEAVAPKLPKPLTNLNWTLGAALAASAILRASYHLYQGPSAGFGNLIMGLGFGYLFIRTGRIWPLIIAHFVMDFAVFLAYPLFYAHFLQ